jgi:beta-lactamase regulating signal transducer with metallopeptidase domain
MQFVSGPIFRIPISPASTVLVENIADPLPATTITTPPPKENAIVQPEVKPAATTAPAKTSQVRVVHLTPIHWAYWLMLVWGLGATFAMLRLMRVQFRLSHLKNKSRLADAPLREQARGIQTKLHVQRSVAIRISDAVSSSFLCGLLKPAILLPEQLVQDLSRDEVSALLAHEIAHVRRHDLFWCVAWQWARAFFWFHPLIWKIPGAHNLACEQEADRIASGHLEKGGCYRQLLARLALRILALPEVETRLALNANSQIAQRLNHLEQLTRSEWNWKHSIAAIAMVGALFLAVTGCEFS